MDEVKALQKMLESPLPSNKYEKILVIENLLKEIDTLRLQLSSAMEMYLESCVDGEDSEYGLETVYDTKKTTDILEDSLKENPDLYDRCLVISGKDAVKLIGQDKIRQLCIKYGGEERTQLISHPTLEQMKKVMTDEEYKKYTYVHYKEKGKRVIKK